MTDQALTSAAELPHGEYAIVEVFGHTTLIGRVTEIERFGTKMLAIEPLFNKVLLPAIFQGGPSIFRLTPCSPEVAWERQPSRQYELPPTIFATVPVAALPAAELATRWNDDLDDNERPF